MTHRPDQMLTTFSGCSVFVPRAKPAMPVRSSSLNSDDIVEARDGAIHEFPIQRLPCQDHTAGLVAALAVIVAQHQLGIGDRDPPFAAEHTDHLVDHAWSRVSDRLAVASFDHGLPHQLCHLKRTWHRGKELGTEIIIIICAKLQRDSPRNHALKPASLQYLRSSMSSCRGSR